MRTAIAAIAAFLVGCSGNTEADLATTAQDATMPSASQLQIWQLSIDQFDGGLRPTGSAADEAFIAWLVDQLTALGVSDVHTEPYTFTRWIPTAWSLELVGGPASGSVALSGYVPYSGATPPGGLTAGLVYLPAPATLASLDPSQLRARVAASLSAIGGVTGRIVVFDVPAETVPLAALTGPLLYTSGGLTEATPVARLGLSAMLYVPAVLDALAAAGAVGAVGILDAPEPEARATYAPFFGTTTPDLPAVYVDRATGAGMLDALDARPLQLAHLTLDATLAPATSENVVGVIPGVRLDQEILLSSHTDGPNSLEDNGPVGILALASYFLQLPQAQRPRTIRIVLTGGHFVGSRGILDYAAVHLAELRAHALAVIELEHLGALEWDEVSPGVMAATGDVEPELVYSWPNPPLVAASLALARQLPRSVVAGPAVLGEGHNFGVVPLVQFLTAPNDLLVGRLPEIATQLTDYDLMRTQLLGFAQMTRSLATAPADQLGVHP
ncbi:MAG TPA: hypothetical protein VLX92_21925 [Kofleriaceae bacterium]|nr:hypothetical protein [Kofleriaceae bacterium]